MLITLSGIDGSGKSSISQRLRQFLCEEGMNAVCIRPEYQSNDILKTFCKMRFGDPYSYIPHLDPNLYICALFTDWIGLLNNVLSTRDDRILICDRYIYDVLAQALHYRANTAPILALIKFFPQPDLSIFLKISPQLAFERLSQRNEPRIHHLEYPDQLKILSDSYEQVKELTGWKREEVDCNIPQDTLLLHIATLAKNKMNL